MIRKGFFWMAVTASSLLRRLSEYVERVAMQRLSSREEPWPSPEPGAGAPEASETRELAEFKMETLSRVMEMGGTVAREVMVPRTDMFCMEAGLAFNDVLAGAVESEHSRIPVYEGKVDNIIGILYSKDLLKMWAGPPEEFGLRKIVRPAYFIPETKPLAVLLREFQRNRVHIAIVVDEYGGTAGLITLEDILEEIIGEIQDEYDVAEERVTKLAEEDFLLDARMDIESVENLLNISIEKGDFESLGGLAITMLGHLPKQGENFVSDGWRFMVDKATDRKVIKIRVKRITDGDNNLSR